MLATHYPAEIIGHAVWLYFRFALSDRDVEELLAARGVVVTYEAVRRWCPKFGRDFADAPRRRAPRRGDKRHLGEVRLGIDGRRFSLWRAVDRAGCGPDIPVRPRRDRRAAQRFFRKLHKGRRDVPRAIITDPLKSDEAARKERIPGIEHRQHQGLNDRAERSHQSTRQRERQRRRFESPGHAQCFSTPMARSTACFAPAVTGWPLLTIAPFAPGRLKPGGR